MTTDMTSGRPLKSIIPFFLSMTVANIFAQLYNIVDSMIVGHTLGEKALAAVGAVGAVNFLLSGIISGFPCTLPILTGQAFGAHDTVGVKKSACVSFIIVVVILTVFEILGQVFLTPLLTVMHTPEDIFGLTAQYLSLTLIGMPFLAVYILFSSQMRALGDSKRPVAIIIASAVLNAGLDFLFVCCFNWGISGAAWATVISQALSAFACAIIIFRSVPELRPVRTSWHNRIELYIRHVSVSAPVAIQYSIMGIGAVILQRAFNNFGSDIVAAVSAASRLDSFVWIPFPALGVTVTAFVAQNYGAKQYRRIWSGVADCLVMMLSFAVIFAILICTFHRQFLSIFLDTDTVSPAILTAGKQFIFRVAPFYPMQGLILLCRNALQGMSSTMIPLVGGILETVCRIFAASYLAQTFGFTGACFANALVWTTNGLLMFVAFAIVLHAIIARSEKANTVGA